MRPIGQVMFNTEQAMGGMTGTGRRGGALRPAGYDRGEAFMDKISMHRGNCFKQAPYGGANSAGWG